MGGYAGLASVMALANELQGEGTVHGHGFIVLNNAYQHNTLQEIAALIESRIQQLSSEEIVQRITDFIDHLQREDHFNEEAHQAQLASLERQFHENNEGPTENVFLAARPHKFLRPSKDAYMCSL